MMIVHDGVVQTDVVGLYITAWHDKAVQKIEATGHEKGRKID